jgi:hypothetical protein
VISTPKSKFLEPQHQQQGTGGVKAPCIHVAAIVTKSLPPRIRETADLPLLRELSDAQRLAEAVLALKPGHWTAEDHFNWRAITGNPIVSYEILRELARKILS